MCATAAPGRRPLLRPWRLLAAAAVAAQVGVVRGQHYDFEKEAVPPPRSLQTLYAFYVYSKEEAPEKGVGNPFVKFSGLSVTPAGKEEVCGPSASQACMEWYNSFQLSIIRYEDFWNLINPEKFCTTEADVQAQPANLPEQLANKKNHLLLNRKAGQTLQDVNVYSHTVRFGAANEDVRQPVEKTGVYLLLFSNCGDFDDATISGSVFVKNSYGFLPGNEYHKLPFYGWLLVAYVVLALTWMALSTRWWRETFMIQHCISAVILFGLFESFAWYILYNDWNSSGDRGKFLFVVSILLTVIKSTVSFMLALVASMGWGITRPYLDAQVVCQIQALSVSYICLDFIKEVVLALRHSHSLSMVFVLLCLLPVSLLNGLIFTWVFTSLASLIETLKERQQNEKLQLFQRLWRILVAALVAATLASIYQVFHMAGADKTSWKYQWWTTDGVAHIVFILVLASMMYLLAPHKQSLRFAYSEQVASHDKGNAPEAPSAIWADDDEDDDQGDGESFWTSARAGAKGRHPAEIIGAGVDRIESGRA